MEHLVLIDYEWSDYLKNLSINDDNFIELATIENGNLKTSQTRRGSAARGNSGVFMMI